MKITRKDALKEVARENKVRHRVYPGWIQRGKLNLDQANKRVLALKKIGLVLDGLTDQQFDAFAALGRAKLAAGGSQQKLPV
jgi:hypothetical protein